MPRSVWLLGVYRACLLAAVFLVLYDAARMSGDGGGSPVTASRVGWSIGGLATLLVHACLEDVVEGTLAASWMKWGIGEGWAIGECQGRQCSNYPNRLASTLRARGAFVGREPAQECFMHAVVRSESVFSQG